MEAFYSQASLHDRFLSEIRSGQAGRPRRYKKWLDEFLRSLPPLLGHSLSEHCHFHDQLVRRLEAGDTILSFNYDCVIDDALTAAGGRRWDPSSGYGFNIGGGALARWRPRKTRGRPPQRGLRLLKPHGSLNWVAQDRDHVVLRADAYEARSPDELVVVPPLWQKDFDKPPFPDVWREARSAFSSTKAMIVVGYSLPPTDFYTQALLRMDVGKLDFLCIANPDVSARERIMGALRSSIAPSTQVVLLRDLAHLAHLLGAPRALATR